MLGQKLKMLLPVQVTTLNFFWKKVFIRISPTNLIEMNNWEETYYNFDSSKIMQALSQIKGVVVGFNVNIDKIIEITPKVLSQILFKSKYQIEFHKERDSATIDSVEDFFFFLLQSIKEGKADEKLLFTRDIHLWIENMFSVKHTKIGGQAGIMANLLKRIGVNQVLLSLPIFDKSLLKLLNPSIQVIAEEDETFIIKPVRELNGNETNTVIHYVFEFKEGFYSINDEVIECRRSNRFIVSYDLINSKLEIRKGFYEYSRDNILNYSLAILSGFHLINPNLEPTKTYFDMIEPVSKLITEWKLSNPDIIIHFEVASTKDIQLVHIIIDELIPSVDSIGLNEQELLDFLAIIDPSTHLLLKDDMSAVNLFKGLLSLLRRYPRLRIHLHYLGFYLLLSSPITKQQVQTRKESLIYASLNAARKAETGDMEFENILSDFTYKVSNEGMEQLISLEKHLNKEFKEESDFSRSGYFNTSSFTLVGIPTIVIKKPKYLVGLGDTISSISILFDNL